MNENVRKFCIGGLLCLWGTTALFAQNIDVTYKNLTLEEVFSDLKQKTNFDFVYQKKILDNTGKVNCSLKNKPFEEVLDVILKGSGLNYEIIDGTVVIHKAIAQQKKSRRIQGVILDAATQTPLPGANIIDLQNKKGTVSDVQGNFVLNVESDTREIEVSFVGYKSSKIKLGNRNSLRVLLSEESALMDEVVVTGIQTIEKGRATGAYNLVKQNDMKNIYSTSLSEKLEGVVPGLYLDKDNNITIRGLSSLNATTKPLIVVDGFPMESSELNLNPNDIEQVTVLKDAASASIWGIRAANGVIVITTKRGANNERVNVNYSGTVTSSGGVDWDDLHILSSDQYVKAKFECILDQGINNKDYTGLNELEKIYKQYDDGNITLENAWAQVNELGKFNNARQITDNFYRHAFTQQHNVSLSAGGKYSSTYLSLSYDQSKAREVGNEYDKFNLLVNNDFKLHRTFTVSVGLRGTFRNAKSNGTDMTDYEPWKRILNDDGSYYNEYNGISEEWAAECEALGMRDWHKNTLEMMRMNDKRTKDYNLSTSLRLNWTPIKGLEITSQGNYEFGQTHYSEYYSQDHFVTRNLTNQYTEVQVVNGHPVAIVEHHVPNSGGLKQLADSHLYSYSIRNMISYSNSFKNLDYKILAGNEVYSLEGNSYSNWLWGFDPELLTSQSVNLTMLQEGVKGYNGNVQTFSPEYLPTYSETLERYVSYFGTATISYKSKYDLFASVRLDQTNLLTNASKFRNNPSWSVGAKWDLSKEAFFKAGFVNMLSLRASYGLTGNIDKSTGPDIVAEAESDLLIPSLNYLVITNPANPSLGWEKTYNWNVGLDYMLFNNRISGSFDFYHKISKGLLADVDIDPTTGWNTFFKNSASVRNVGLDLSLNARILTTKSLKWDVTLNLSYNKNRVTQISYTPSRAGAMAGNPMQGQPIGYLAVHRYGGLDENGEPTFMKKGDDTRYPYTSLDILTLDDLEFVGTTNPPVFGGLSSNLTYKDFTLSFMLTYKFGNKLQLPNPLPSMFGLYSEWFGEEYRWIEGDDNSDKWVPKLYTTSSWSPTNRNSCLLSSDKMIDKGDVIYLRSISLTYNVTRLLNYIGLKGGSVSIGGENLGYWAANKYNIDPDQLINGTCILGKTPRLVVGLNINF